MKKIGEWAIQSRLDPNDPKNTSIMHLLKVRSTRDCFPGFPLNKVKTPDKNSRRVFTGGDQWRGGRSRLLSSWTPAGGVQLCKRWGDGEVQEVPLAQAEEPGGSRVSQLQICSSSGEGDLWQGFPGQPSNAVPSRGIFWKGFSDDLWVVTTVLLSLWSEWV